MVSSTSAFLFASTLLALEPQLHVRCVHGEPIAQAAPEDKYAAFTNSYVGSDSGEDDLVAQGSIAESRPSEASDTAPETESKGTTFAQGASSSLDSTYTAALQRGADWRPATVVPADEYRKELFFTLDGRTRIEKVAVKRDGNHDLGTTPAHDGTSEQGLLHHRELPAAFAEVSIADATPEFLQADANSSTAAQTALQQRAELVFTCVEPGTAKIGVDVHLTRDREAGGKSLASDPHRAVVRLDFEKHCSGFPVVGLSLVEDGPVVEQACAESSCADTAGVAGQPRTQASALQASTSGGESARRGAERPLAENVWAYGGVASGVVNETRVLAELQTREDLVKSGFTTSPRFDAPTTRESFVTGAPAAVRLAQYAAKNERAASATAAQIELLERERAALLTAVAGTTTSADADDLAREQSSSSEQAEASQSGGEQLRKKFSADAPLYVFDSGLKIPLRVKLADHSVTFAPVRVDVSGSLSRKHTRYSGALADGGGRDRVEKEFFSSSTHERQRPPFSVETVEKQPARSERALAVIQLLDDVERSTAGNDDVAGSDMLRENKNPRAPALVKAELPDRQRSFSSEQEQQTALSTGEDATTISSAASTTGRAELFLKCGSFGPGVVTVTFSPFPPFQPYAPVRVQRGVFCGHERQRESYRLEQLLQVGDGGADTSREVGGGAKTISSGAASRRFSGRHEFLSAAEIEGATASEANEYYSRILEGDRKIGDARAVDWDEAESVFRIANGDAADEFQVDCTAEDAAANDADTSGDQKLNVRTTFDFHAAEEAGNGNARRNTGHEGASTSFLRVEYFCERSGRYECLLQPRWAAVREQYRGDGFRFIKQCGGSRGISVISRDATMLGPLPLQTSEMQHVSRTSSAGLLETSRSATSVAEDSDGEEDQKLHKDGPKLKFPEEATLATFVLHAEKPVKLSGPVTAKSLQPSLLSVKMLRGGDVDTIGKDTVLTTEFVCSYNPRAVPDSNGLADVEISLPVTQPLKRDARAITFHLQKQCEPLPDPTARLRAERLVAVFVFFLALMMIGCWIGGAKDSARHESAGRSGTAAAPAVRV